MKVLGLLLCFLAISALAQDAPETSGNQVADLLKELSANLKKLEESKIQHLLDTVAALQKKSESEDKISALEKEFAGLQAKLDAVSASLKTDISAYRDEVKAASGSSSSASVESQVSEQLSKMDQKFESLNELLSKLTAEQASLTKRLQETKEEALKTAQELLPIDQLNQLKNLQGTLDELLTQQRNFVEEQPKKIIASVKTAVHEFMQSDDFKVVMNNATAAVSFWTEWFNKTAGNMTMREVANFGVEILHNQTLWYKDQAMVWLHEIDWDEVRLQAHAEVNRTLQQVNFVIYQSIHNVTDIVQGYHNSSMAYLEAKGLPSQVSLIAAAVGITTVLVSILYLSIYLFFRCTSCFIECCCCGFRCFFCCRKKKAKVQPEVAASTEVKDVKDAKADAKAEAKSEAKAEESHKKKNK